MAENVSGFSDSAVSQLENGADSITSEIKSYAGQLMEAYGS